MFDKQTENSKENQRQTTEKFVRSRLDIKYKEKKLELQNNSEISEIRK